MMKTFKIIAFLVILSILQATLAGAAPLSSETSLGKDARPVFPQEIKQQLEGREKPTQTMITEGKLTPGTWTVKILDNRVVKGHNPVNTAQPLYNFTMNGVTYEFDSTKVEDPVLLLKTAVTIQTQGAGSLDMKDPIVQEAVKQLEKMSNGTLHITEKKPQPKPDPLPPPTPATSCFPLTFTLSGNSGNVIFMDLSKMPDSCTVGAAPGEVTIVVQNPDTSCRDAGTKLFFSVIPASALISTGAGFSKYFGMCQGPAGLNAVDASFSDNQAVIQTGGKKYLLKFSTSNGGLQSIPYSHNTRYNSITLHNVSATELP